MSDNIDLIFKVFKHFNRFFKWLYDTLKFYTQPKSFIEGLLKLNVKDFTKHLLEYFILFESILLIIASTLIDNIQFSLYKILGLLLLDFIFALPLILIISFSLFIGRVLNPIKKSISFILLFKIFYGFPIQIFFFLFIFFENYVFYILFGAGLQLLAVFLIFSPSIFFSKRKKQTFVILISTLGLFILFIFTYTQIHRLNPSTDNLEDYDFYFDPIFSEYRALRAKAKLIDEIKINGEIDSIENYRGLIYEDSFEEDLKALKDDQKYHNELVLERISFENEYFNDKENYNFKINKQRFENYLEFLNRLSYFQEEYYNLYDIFKLEKQIKNIQHEINLMKEEFSKIPEYEIMDFNELDLSNLNEKEMIKVLEEKTKKIKLATEKEEFRGDILKKEISIWQNKTKIQEIKISILKKFNELSSSRLRFTDEEINYYSFIIRLHELLYIY